MARRLVVPALALWCTLAPAAPLRAQEAPLQAGESARMPGVPFEELARKASEAAESGHLVEAVRFYRAGLELNPLWSDGWWRLGLVQFERERFAEARDALRRLVRLEDGVGASWALLGLSEYRLGELDRALASLTMAVRLGVPPAEPMGRESIHHLALLLIRSGQFASSASYLSRLVELEPDDPDLVAACGLMALRLARLPSEVPPGEKDLVNTAGRATYAAFAYREDEARRGFEDLVARYPGVRGVHYAYGLFLSRHASSESLPMLRREVELHPDHLEAHLEIAFAILDRGDPKEALAPARAAVRLGPELAAAHLVLGRALVAHDALDEGIRELEEAVRLDPEVRDAYLALALACARAGRPDDVQRARAKLIELDAKRGAR